MFDRPPRVSIGLPVYNGEKYLRQALDSLLAQTFTDFEIVICDNASTDQTEAICREYAARDNRIRYYRNERNLGAAPNFNRAFYLSRGQYFKWAAHDDFLSPEFLMESVHIMKEYSSVVLCHSETVVVDEYNKIIKLYNASNLTEVESIHPHRRISSLMRIEHSCYDIFGLIRSEILRCTPLIQSYVGSDRNLLVELATHGRFFRIPRFIFYAREHQERSTRKVAKLIKRGTWFDTKNNDLMLYPHWRNLFGYAKSIYRAPISLRDRLYCYKELCLWARLNRWRLQGDIIEAINTSDTSI